MKVRAMSSAPSDSVTPQAAHQLYGADISYYTGKVRAYLRCRCIPFDEVTATRAVYKEIILPRVGWPVVPVVVTADDQTLQDSSDIIDAFEARYPEWSVYPDGPRQRIVSLLLECYGDEWLKLPAMHYRWNHNLDWIVGEFGRMSRPDLDLDGQRAVGAETCKPFRGSLPMLGVTAATAGAVEQSYEALLRDLNAHFLAHEFLLGDRPTIGDFGFIGPLYAHQYRDPSSGALMRRIAPAVAAWVERLHEPSAPERFGAARLVADDGIPATLLPVLARLVREYGPVLGQTAAAFQAWVGEHPGAQIPRSIGQHGFVLEGTAGERQIFTFDLWMLQRVLDVWRGLDAETRAAHRPWFAEQGLLPLLELEYPRLTRRSFQLALG